MTLSKRWTASQNAPRIRLGMIRGMIWSADFAPEKVLCPNPRLPAHARLLRADVRTLVVTSSTRSAQLAEHVEGIALPAENGSFDPAAILSALAERGFRRVLVEGGAATVSRFLAARCLDRLHILVAPMILGAGRPSLTLPPVFRVEDAPR